MNQKISIIGSAGIPAAYGGFETLVEQLVRNSPQEYLGYKLVVYCSGKEKLKEFAGATLKYVNLNPNGISSIPYDVVSMIRAGIDKSNCLLVLGVSGAIFIPIYKFFFGGRIVTNVDGIEWRREKWSWLPSKFLKLSEFIAVRFSDEIISDNEAVAEYIFNEYGRKSIVIPYGGDHIDLSVKSKNNIYSKLKAFSYFLSVCRIEPENNIEIILEAYSKIPTQDLVFIGNWDNSKYGKQLKNRFQQYKNLYLLNPIYEQSELNFFRDGCIGYVHGHSAGGTNPSLVEAMYFSNFILCFDCDFNRFTTENSAQYFLNSSELIEIIKNQDSKSQDKTLLYEIAMRRYNWGLVSKAYFELFTA